MNNHSIEERLNKIESLLEQQSIVNKEMLNLKEACLFLDLSQSAIYKMTFSKKIPFYRPQGKKIYFLKEELKNWVLKSRVRTVEEIEKEAIENLKLRRR